MLFVSVWPVIRVPEAHTCTHSRLDIRTLMVSAPRGFYLFNYVLYSLN